MTRRHRQLRTYAGTSVGALVLLSSVVAPPVSAHVASLRPAACSPTVTSQLAVMEKWVTKAYDEFNIGNPKKTEPAMRNAIKAARKARSAATSESTKQVLTAFIDIGADKYRVSSMADALVAVQDNVMAGC